MKLALGRMPILTRRSRTDTLQIISARLSKNGPWLLLPRIHLLLDRLLRRERAGSEGVAALGFGFCCARSLLSCLKLHWCPFEHWPFSFH